MAKEPEYYLTEETFSHDDYLLALLGLSTSDFPRFKEVCAALTFISVYCQIGGKYNKDGRYDDAIDKICANDYFVDKREQGTYMRFSFDMPLTHNSKRFCELHALHIQDSEKSQF